MYLVQAVHTTTSSSWRPQLPLPKTVPIVDGEIEKMQSKKDGQPSSKNKWSFGGFFRKKKKDPDSESTSEEDRKAGFLPHQKSSTSYDINNKNKKPKKKRANRLTGTFDHIVIYPAERVNVGPTGGGGNYIPDNLNAAKRVPSIDSNRSGTGSLDRRLRQDRVKLRYENSSSDDDSLNSSSISRFRSDESLSNVSLSRRSRAARNERYKKRLSKEEGALSHQGPPTLFPRSNTNHNFNSNGLISNNSGSTRSFDVMYQRPQKLHNSSSLTQVNQLMSMSQPQSRQSSLRLQLPPNDVRSTSFDNYINVMKNPPAPPPRDPHRRLTINNPVDSRPISYAFDKYNNPSSSSHGMQLSNAKNRCVSDDKLWGPPQNANILTPQRPASVQPVNNPRKNVINPEPDYSLQNRNMNIPSNQAPNYKYIADITPRSRRPIHIVEDTKRDQPNPPSFIFPNNAMRKTPNDKSPVNSASNFWRKMDQQEIMRRTRPNEVVTPKLIKPRSASSPRNPIPMNYTKVIPTDDSHLDVVEPRLSKAWSPYDGGRLSIYQNDDNQNESFGGITPRGVDGGNTHTKSMPTYLKKRSSPPVPSNKYDEYIRRRNKTQPVSNYDLQSILSPESNIMVVSQPIVAPKLKTSKSDVNRGTQPMYSWMSPPEPPRRIITKRNSFDDDIKNIKPPTKNGNLDDAINELEAIYKSLKLCDDNLMERANQPIVWTPPVKQPSDISVSNMNNLPSKSLNFEDVVDDDDDEEDNGEPDIVLDDLVYRNFKHANSTLKTVDPQPPFGIPIGPIPPPPETDYIKVKKPERPKMMFIPCKSPDLVADDLAYRTLRKDNGFTSGIKETAKIDHFVKPSANKKKAIRSMSANIYSMIQRDAARPSGGRLEDYLELDKALSKAESLTDLNKDDDHPSTLWWLKKNRREEQSLNDTNRSPHSLTDPSRGAVFNLPSTLNLQTTKPYIGHKDDSVNLKPPKSLSRKSVTPDTDRNNYNNVYEALVKEAKETSEKLGQDLIDLRNESKQTTPVMSVKVSPKIENVKHDTQLKSVKVDNTLNEIDGVSNAAKMCEKIIQNFSNDISKENDLIILDDSIEEIKIQPAKDMATLTRLTPVKDNNSILENIDEVSDAAKSCESLLGDILSQGSSVQPMKVEVKKSSSELQETKDDIIKKQSTIRTLMDNIEPVSMKITDRCVQQLEELEKMDESKPLSIYDGPDYDNLNTDLINKQKLAQENVQLNPAVDIKSEDDTIDLLIFNQSPTQDDKSDRELSIDLEDSVNKQIALVEDIDKIIQEAADVIKSSEANSISNHHQHHHHRHQRQHRDDNIQSDDEDDEEDEVEKLMMEFSPSNQMKKSNQSSSENIKSSSATPNRLNSSSITSFNPMSSSDYIKSPSSEFQNVSDNIKSTSTTSYDVKSSSVTPNHHIESPFSNSSCSPIALTPMGEDVSQYNSSEELAMIFGTVPSSTISAATTTVTHPTSTGSDLLDVSNIAYIECPTNNQNSLNRNTITTPKIIKKIAPIEKTSTTTATTTTATIKSDLIPRTCYYPIRNSKSPPTFSNANFKNYSQVKNIKSNSSTDLKINKPSSSTDEPHVLIKFGEDDISNSCSGNNNSSRSHSNYLPSTSGHKKLFDLICEENELSKNMSSSSSSSLQKTTVSPSKLLMPTKTNYPLTKSLTANPNYHHQMVLNETENHDHDDNHSQPSTLTQEENLNHMPKGIVNDDGDQQVENHNSNGSTGMVAVVGGKVKTAAAGPCKNDVVEKTKRMKDDKNMKTTGAEENHRKTRERSKLEKEKELKLPLKYSFRSKVAPAATNTTANNSNLHKASTKITTSTKSRVNSNYKNVANSTSSLPSSSSTSVVTIIPQQNLRPKSTPIVGSQTKLSKANSVASSNGGLNSIGEQNHQPQKTVRTTRASRLRAAFHEHPEGPLTNRTDDAGRSQSTSSSAEHVVNKLREDSTNRSLSKSNSQTQPVKKPSSKNSLSTKRLVASIEVSVKQTLKEDDVLVPPNSNLSQDLENLFSNRIITTSSSSTVTLRSDKLAKADKSASAVTTKDAEKEEKDKSSKRKSNLNRSHNEEAIKDEDLAERKRRRRALGKSRTLITEDVVKNSTLGQSLTTKPKSVVETEEKVVETPSISDKNLAAESVSKIISTKSPVPLLATLPKIETVTLQSIIEPNSSHSNNTLETPIVPQKSTSTSTIDDLHRINNEIKNLDLISKTPKSFASASTSNLPHNDFENKLNRFMLECDKKIESLTPIRDLRNGEESSTQSPQQQLQPQKQHPYEDKIGNPDVDDLKRNTVSVSPLKAQHRSLDEIKSDLASPPAQSHIISILKKKDSNDSSSSSNISPVTFSSSVQDTPTRGPSKSGILKKRSSLDESRYSRSQSPDERGILVRSHRRNSLEELQHGILKQTSYECKTDATGTPQSEPHSILKKKDTPTGVEPQYKHVSIVEAALLATAKLSKDCEFIEYLTSSDKRKILKTDSSTQNTPRPILKKKNSSETEEIRPILKSSRKSSREEISSTDTEDNINIRSILKTESPIKRLNHFIAVTGTNNTGAGGGIVCGGDTIDNIRRSRSLEHESPPLSVAIADKPQCDGDDGSLPQSPSHLESIEKPTVTVAERIKNMEKFLGAVPKVKSIPTSKRFKTQPITMDEWSSILPQLKPSPTAPRKFENTENKFSQSSLSSPPPTLINLISNSNNIQCNSNTTDSKTNLFSNRSDIGLNSLVKMDKNADLKTGEKYSKEIADEILSPSKSSVKNKAVMLENLVQQQKDENFLTPKIPDIPNVAENVHSNDELDSSKWRFSEKFRFFTKLTKSCNSESLNSRRRTKSESKSKTQIELLKQKTTHESNAQTAPSQHVKLNTQQINLTIIEPLSRKQDQLIKSKVDSFEKDFDKISRLRTSTHSKLICSSDSNSIMETTRNSPEHENDNCSIGGNSDDSNFDSGKENVENSSFEDIQSKITTTHLENRRNKLNSTNKSLLVSGGEYSSQYSSSTSSVWENSCQKQSDLKTIGDTETSNSEHLSKSVMLESRKKLIEKMQKNGVDARVTNGSPPGLLRNKHYRKSAQFNEPQLRTDCKKSIPKKYNDDSNVHQSQLSTNSKWKYDVVFDFDELLNDPELKIENAELEFNLLFNDHPVPSPRQIDPSKPPFQLPLLPTSLLKSKSGGPGLFPSDFSSELKNRLKKSSHASVSNLKKSASSVGTDTMKLDHGRQDLSNSSDSDDIAPGRNLAKVLRNVTKTSGGILPGDDNHNDIKHDDAKILVNSLKNFDKSQASALDDARQQASTSEGESSGGREISAIIKNSAVVRRKKHNDGYKQWTGPEYYKNAEEHLQRSQEKKAKEESLKLRRSKLLELLQTEKGIYNHEIEEANRPKPKCIPINVLNGIVKNINHLENEKLRANLEAKLYNRMRYENCPDPERQNIILNAKNENQAMAKLNWLDKQVENQLEIEKKRKESEDRQLKIQEEMRKHEEIVKECRQLRESQFKELRSIQENNIKELKLRELETHELRSKEVFLRTRLEDMANELQTLEINSISRLTNSHYICNIRRVKMLFRKRSEEIQRNIIEDIKMLKNVTSDLDPNDKLCFIEKKFEKQLEDEHRRREQLDRMYESEANQQFVKQEQLWAEESRSREFILKSMIHERIKEYEDKIKECLNDQKNILELKESYLQSLNTSNDRVKELMHDEENFITNSVKKFPEISSEILIKSTKPHNCHENNEQIKLEPPKFGRKKVAWI